MFYQQPRSSMPIALSISTYISCPMRANFNAPSGFPISNLARCSSRSIREENSNFVSRHAYPSACKVQPYCQVTSSYLLCASPNAPPVDLTSTRARKVPTLLDQFRIGHTHSHGFRLPELPKLCLGRWRSRLLSCMRCCRPSTMHTGYSFSFPQPHGMRGGKVLLVV